MTKKELTPAEQNNCIQILKERFEKNMHRHQDLDWQKIEERIINQPEKIWSLHQMEITGGEPDVVFYNENTDEYTFFDCSVESPKGRRSVCYDKAALEGRKENKPRHSAIAMEEEMGIEILTKEQYAQLQKLGEFDTKTSNWVKTPDEIRALGGAIFCDRRYNEVFTYHNGADSYYSVRGFRGSIKI